MLVGFAAAFLAAVSLLSGAPVGQILVNVISTWAPAIFLASLMRSQRSLTLALQVSVVIALMITAGFFIVFGDPAIYWGEVLTEITELYVRSGLILQENATILMENRDDIVQQMTMYFVFFSWCLNVLVLVLGYSLFRSLPEQAAVCGEFRDLNFGRILAGFMALASVLAMLFDANWLQNIAFVAFAVFWVQGIAILHWLRARKRLPVAVLIAAYVLLPISVIALAIVGYTDAWFNYRARGVTA